MKIAALIARIVLGLVFVVFGSNAFLNFIPAMLPPGQAGQFLTLLMDSHYVLAISVFELVGGALLIIGWYVPLGLVLLGPVIMNILLFHLLLYHPGLGARMCRFCALVTGFPQESAAFCRHFRPANFLRKKEKFRFHRILSRNWGILKSRSYTSGSNTST